MNDEEFAKRHPYPDKAGIDRLFKFTSFDESNPDRLAHLLVDGLLYHSLPRDFNDPWEAKPWVRLPEKPADVGIARKHMIRSLVGEGISKKKASQMATDTLADREGFQDNLVSALEDVFGEVLICSLSSTKENILLWGHYAASHKGLCIEFDCKHRPFFFAFKVHYQSQYPSVGYPMHLKEPFDVLSTKAEEWSYEREYRVLYNRPSTPPGQYQEQSAVLDSRALSAIYLGARMTAEHREHVLQLVRRGPFEPRVFQAILSPSMFSIVFEQIA